MRMTTGRRPAQNLPRLRGQSDGYLTFAFVGDLTGLCGEVSTPGKVMHIYVLTNREAARRLICRRNDTSLGDCAMLHP